MSIFKQIINFIHGIKSYKVIMWFAGCWPLPYREWRRKDVRSIKISQPVIRKGSGEWGHRLGTSFAIVKSIIVKDVKDSKDKSLKILALIEFQMVLINAQEEFYFTLEDFVSVSTSSVKIVQRDFNANIGKYTHYRNVVGVHRLYQIINDNGTELINFAIAKGLFIKNTKDIHKYIWIYFDGKHNKQMIICW